MSVAWSIAYAALFFRWGGRVAGIMALAAFSHFLLDVPMHPPDLALWPDSDVHIGFGLWTALPQGWWFVELAVIALAGGYYLKAARASRTFGRRPIAVVTVVVLLHIFNAPWLSPL